MIRLSIWAAFFVIVKTRYLYSLYVKSGRLLIETRRILILNCHNTFDF